MSPNQHIAELGPLLEQLGIHHVIIAPGSRNAPMIQLFTYNQPFHCYSIVDERSAGYVALGMAVQLGQPVAVVTTSGTAVLNLAPAVAEAFYRRVPLVILTADRPVEPIPQFNNQVIDQVAPYYNFTKGFYEMPMDPGEEEVLRQVMLHVESLVKEGLEYPAGPVHINVPLQEPLYDPLPRPVLDLKVETEKIPWTGTGPDPIPVKVAGKKILVLAGSGRYSQPVRKQLQQLAMHPSVVVVAENITNLHSERFITRPEVLLGGAGENEQKELMPDLVIGLGGQVVSKRLKNLIQSDQSIRSLVPEGELSLFIQGLLDQLDSQDNETGSDYYHAWESVRERVSVKADRLIESLPFGNLAGIREVIRQAPPGAVLHLGNSTTIRYSQLIPVRDDLSYEANRGTSGIDGSVSTAVGAALVSDQLHLLVVGDLSFVYDSNSLWNKNFPGNLRIIVLNDGGGSIFRLLEGPGRMDFFEEFSVTHHPVSIELLAQAFGRRFARVSGTDELREHLEALMKPESALSVLEVDTTASENSHIFTSFFQKIRS